MTGGNRTSLGSGEASISFKSEISSAFRIQRVLLTVDGAVVCSRAAEPNEPFVDPQSVPGFSGTLPEGDHELRVLVTLSGFGVGVFSYLRGYKFEVRSSHIFHVDRGKRAEVSVIAHEKGGVTTPLEERPAIRYTDRRGVITVPVARPDVSPDVPPFFPSELPPPPPPPPP